MSELESEQATPEAAEPVEPEAPAEESWSGPSQEEWQEAQDALAYFSSLPQLQPWQSQQDAGPEPVQLDPLDDNFQSQLDQYIDQKFSGYQEYVQAQQFREGEARAQDIIADDIAANGEFLFNDPKAPEGDSKEKARALANNYIGEMNQQYPREPGRAAEAALHKAAQVVRDWEQAVGKAYHEREINQLQTLSGARPQAGVGTNGTQQFTIPPGGTLLDVVSRHVS